MKAHMKFWGISGGIGSGKSEVLRELERLDYPVLDADRIARQVVDPSVLANQSTLQDVVELVGTQIQTQDGGLDRAALRTWISESDDNRRALERILHPRIREHILLWLEREKLSAFKPAGFIEGSRMIESGLYKQLDGLLWVQAPAQLRIERASQRDSKSVDEICALAKLQLPDEEFAAHATHTLVNDAGLEELKHGVQDFLRKTGLLIWILLFSAPLYAQDSQEWFPSARARSMGLALTAIVDDHDALHSNPAGLALVQKKTLRLPNFFMGAFSGSFKEVFEKLRDLSTDGNGSVAQQLQLLDGTAAGAELSLLSLSWVGPRLGISVNPFGVNFSARVRTPSLLFAKVDLLAAAQGGVTMGYAHPLMGENLRVGVALRPFAYRLGLDAQLENQSIVEAGENFSDYSGGGWGMDFDVGVQGGLDPIEVEGAALRLMAGTVLQNTLANRYPFALVSGMTSRPPASDRRVNVGFAARLENPGVLEPTVSVEFRDLLTGYDEFLEFFHVGFELKIRPRDFYSNALRLHLAKGNVGGGFAFHWKIFELELGTYAVNLGPGPGIGRDRRYFAQASLVF
jgi:dephospho-CoA kinase